MNSKQNMTRRGFLRGAASAAVVSTAAGSIAFASADEVAWDKEADFVVVGTGTGLVGALGAAEAGLEVIALEKRPVTGGAMKFSGGNFWLANNRFSREAGDTYELAQAYVHHMMQCTENDEIEQAYLNNTDAVLDIFEKAGIEVSYQDRCTNSQCNWEGGLVPRRTCCIKPEDGSEDHAENGFLVANALEQACLEHGVEIMTDTTGDTLVTVRESSDAAPSVVGIIAKDADGSEIKIRARKGILLATGGFEWNERYCQNFLRVPSRYGLSWPTNSGDTLRMVMSLGADLANMQHLIGQPVFTVHGEYAREHGEIMSMAGQMARYNAGSIMVDQNGRRFCREDSVYTSVNNCFGGYNNFGDEGYTCDPAWWICDQVSYDTYGGVNGACASMNYPVPDIPEEEFVFKANTLEELAEQIGVPAAQLVKTVDEYNEGAAQGIDPLFHRGEVGAWGVGTEVPLATMEQGPFYAVAMSAGCLGTMGGPRLNGNAQVMHASGEVINGLYACGNGSGVGMPGMGYGGSGGSLGPGFTFAAIAANHVASL